MPVTIEDIARKVGRSITTVSRALHDYADVSQETKEMVRKAAAEMGYTPSTLAQRLQKQRADTLGLVLPTFGPRFSDPFFSEFIAGIGNKAAELGYDLLVSTRPPGDGELEAYRQIVQSRRVDGFIIVRTRREDARIQYLHAAGIPFVAFGRMDNQIDFPYVDEDGELGMRALTHHIIEQGHRRIALITALPELTFTEHRLRGWKKELAAHELPAEAELIRSGDLTQRCGYKLAGELLDLSDPPTAIMACNDLMAFGALRAAQERGLVVGRDVAITGFDDIPLAEHAQPPLTTLHQPIYNIGNQVTEMLIRIIQNRPVPERHVILAPKLIIRQSSLARSQQTFVEEVLPEEEDKT